MWSNCKSKRERKRIATNVEKKKLQNERRRLVVSYTFASTRSCRRSPCLFSFVRRQMNLLLKLENWLKTLQIDKEERTLKEKSRKIEKFSLQYCLFCRPQHGLNRKNLHEHQILTTRLVHINLSITYFTLVSPRLSSLCMVEMCEKLRKSVSTTISNECLILSCGWKFLSIRI